MESFVWSFNAALLGVNTYYLREVHVTITQGEHTCGREPFHPISRATEIIYVSLNCDADSQGGSQKQEHTLQSAGHLGAT